MPKVLQIISSRVQPTCDQYIPAPTPTAGREGVCPKCPLMATCPGHRDRGFVPVLNAGSLSLSPSPSPQGCCQSNVSVLLSVF